MFLFIQTSWYFVCAKCVQISLRSYTFRFNQTNWYIIWAKFVQISLRSKTTYKVVSVYSVLPAVMATQAKLTLKSNDNELFEVGVQVASESQHIKNMVEDVGTAEAIPLHNVSGKILSKVIEYCKYHFEAQNPVDENSAPTDDEIKTWDQDFVKVDQATLFEVIQVLSET